MMRGDLDAFTQHFALPLQTESFHGARVIECPKALNEMAQEVLTFYRVNNVTQLVRQVLSADFQDENSIHSVHDSRCLSGNTVLQHQTCCLSRLRNFGGVWKIDLMHYASSDSNSRFDRIFESKASVTVTPPEDGPFLRKGT